MPWRLVLFIIIFAIFLVFIMFNLGNTCDINLGFTVFRDVPVFLTAFSAFIGGMLCTLPFVFAARRRKKEKPPQEKKKWGKKPDKPQGDSAAADGQYGID
jgi:uncharacterized integral membrane protein